MVLTSLSHHLLLHLSSSLKPTTTTTTTTATTTTDNDDDDDLSTLLGSISLTCWVFLLVPQIVENHRNRSASALSLNFLLLWAAGDACNLVGAVWAGLLPTVVAVAAYWCVADGVAVGQWGFYAWVDQGRGCGRGDRRGDGDVMDEEEEPLLESQRQRKKKKRRRLDESNPKGQLVYGSTSSSGSGSDFVSDAASSQHQRTTSNIVHGIGHSRRGTGDTLDDAADDSESSSLKQDQDHDHDHDHDHDQHKDPSIADGKDNKHLKAWLKNTLCILLVILIGTTAWAIARHLGVWSEEPQTRPQPTAGISPTAITTTAIALVATTGTTPTTDITVEPNIQIEAGAGAGSWSSQSQSQSPSPIGAQILGYASAVAYLGARIPQIVKNVRSQSCQGLSLLFFLLSLLGNLTYGLGILAHSLRPDYLVTNAPWLIGSLGTMVQDGIIFGQFAVYG